VVHPGASFLLTYILHLDSLQKQGAVVKDPDDIEVQTMSRNTSSSSLLCSRPSDLLFGPMQFAAILVYVGLYRFMTQEAAILVAALGVGDACLAPLVGSLFGRHVYHMPLADAKTMEGSLSVFVGTCIGIYLLLPCMGLPLLPLRMVLVHAGLAAVVEGSSPSHVDNLAIALMLHFSMNTVHEWLLLTPAAA
jgi:dolichol kinase